MTTVQATPKERPILFSVQMVRSILSGIKTQTRRIVKPQPVCDATAWACYFDRANLDGQYGPPCWGLNEAPGDDMLLHCPHGQPGDRLWLREAWALREDVDWATDPVKAQQYCLYRAGYDGDLQDEYHHVQRWRPSIHMPRCLSRITLELTDVRVELLHDISEADAKEEGVPVNLMGSTYRVGFENLWNSINGCNAFEKCNPWVWVVCFKRVSQ